MFAHNGACFLHITCLIWIYAFMCVYLFVFHRPVRLEVPPEQRTMVIIFSSVCRDCGSLSAIKLHEKTKQVKARTCLTPKREIQRATFRFGQCVAYLDRERKPPHQPGLYGSCPTQQQERHEIKGLKNCKCKWWDSPLPSLTPI